MLAFQPVQFEKYLLLDKIATGGMAELYRAKINGVQGFQKLVAIKKVLPHLASEASLINSFIDEAKLAAFLQHQNIVQIYDFGNKNDNYFIAMEYLSGKDLRFIIQKSNQMNMPLSLENILYIVSKICEGLYYAHNLKDFNGKLLNIIHRDIGPQNIFITYDGQVKIIDFGIAKAASQNTTTQAGTIKGKVAYMSPEQAMGTGIDHRSDIFAIGIILYEMTTCKRMFEGDTMQVYDNVRKAIFEPPESANPDLPSSLYKIINKALMKNPEERYQSADEMNADLEKLIGQHSFLITERSLSQYMKKLFKEEANAEKLAMREAARLDLEEKPDVSKSTRDSYAKTIIAASKKNERKANKKKSLYVILALALMGLGTTISLSFFKDSISDIKPALSSISHIFSDDFKKTNINPKAEKNKDKGKKASLSKTDPGTMLPINQDSKPEPTKIKKAEKLINANRFAEAAALFEDLLAKEPLMKDKVAGPYALALHGQAEKLMESDQVKAVALLLKSINLDKNNAQGHYFLGRIYAEQKKYPAAIESYQKAVKLNPEMSKALFNLGYTYAITKKYSKAQAIYKRVIELFPPFLDEALFNLALVQAKLGKSQNSIKNLELAVKINPANQQAKKFLQYLKQKTG